VKKKEKYDSLYGEYYEYKLFGFIPIILNPKRMVYVDNKTYKRWIPKHVSCRCILVSKKRKLTKKDEGRYQWKCRICGFINTDLWWLNLLKDYCYMCGVKK